MKIDPDTHLTPSLNLEKRSFISVSEHILEVHHILVACNLLAKKKRKYIFGRRDVVEAFRFHPTLVLILWAPLSLSLSLSLIMSVLILIELAMINDRSVTVYPVNKNKCPAERISAYGPA